MEKIKHPLNWASHNHASKRPADFGLGYDPVWPRAVFGRAEKKPAKYRWDINLQARTVRHPEIIYSPNKGPWRSIANLNAGFGAFPLESREYWARCMFWSVPIVELTEKLIEGKATAEEVSNLKNYLSMAKKGSI